MRDLALSISAGVGVIALSGIAVLNDVVILSLIRQRREAGETLDAVIFDGEVQRPLASVVIDAIIPATVLSLLVLPALHRIIHTGEHRTNMQSGLPAPAQAE